MPDIPENINRISGYHSKYKGSEVEDALDRVRLNLDGELQDIRDLIESEETRALQAEINLQDQLDAEIERAEQAEDLIQDNLLTEQYRAQTAEDELRDMINSEKDRATTVEEDLQNQITQEVQDREQAVSELADELEKQMIAAFHYKGSVETPSDLMYIIEPKVGDVYNCKEDGTNFIYAGYNENGEPLGDQEGEISCWDKTSSLLDMAGIEQNALDIAAETDRATQAEADLDAKIDAETDRATQVEQDLQDQIDAEVQRAMDAESQLQDNLLTETQRASDAEAALDAKIDAEIQRASDAEAALDAKIDAETDRATQVEQDLQDQIDAEVQRASDAEQNLQDQIDAEVQRAMDAESDLQDSVLTEQYRAETAEQNLQDQIDAEVQRAQQAEISLYNADEALSDRVQYLEDWSQGAVTAGDAIALDENNKIDVKYDGTTILINENNELYVNALPNLETEVTQLRTDLTAEVDRATAVEGDLDDRVTHLEDWSQGAVTAGDAIALDENNKIDVKFDGDTIRLNEDNELYIDNLQHTLTPGANITISENNTISIIDAMNAGKVGSSVVLYKKGQPPILSKEYFDKEEVTAFLKDKVDTDLMNMKNLTQIRAVVDANLNSNGIFYRLYDDTFIEQSWTQNISNGGSATLPYSMGTTNYFITCTFVDNNAGIVAHCYMLSPTSCKVYINNGNTYKMRFYACGYRGV